MAQKGTCLRLAVCCLLISCNYAAPFRTLQFDDIDPSGKPSKSPAVSRTATPGAQTSLAAPASSAPPVVTPSESYTDRPTRPAESPMAPAAPTSMPSRPAESSTPSQPSATNSDSTPTPQGTRLPDTAATSDAVPPEESDIPNTKQPIARPSVPEPPSGSTTPASQNASTLSSNELKFPAIDSNTAFPMPFPDHTGETKSKKALPKISLFDSAATPNGSFPNMDVSQTLASITPEFPKNAKAITNQQETETTTNDKGVPIRITKSTKNDEKPKIRTEVIHPAERETPEIITDADSEAPDSDYSDGPGPELPASSNDKNSSDDGTEDPSSDDKE